MKGQPLDQVVESIASGDPYWHSQRGMVMQGQVLRQIADEWRTLSDENRVLKEIRDDALNVLVQVGSKENTHQG